MVPPEGRAAAPGTDLAAVIETQGSSRGPVALNGAPKPRMLLVARGFPPASDPTSYRWLRFASGLLKRGWAVEVLTAEAVPRLEYYDPDLARRIPADMAVHRASAGLYEPRVLRARLAKGIPGRNGGAGGAQLAERAYGPGPGRVVRSALRDLDESLSVFKIPDSSFEWIVPATLLGLRLLAGRRYDLIVSSGAPFSSHVVAHRLARWSHAPWVADFSDPYADNPFRSRPGWRISVDRALENAWFGSLSGAIVPVPEMKRLFLEQHPALRPDAVHIIPYGYDDSLFARTTPAAFEGFTVVHTGTFYPGMRDPEPFLRGLALAKHLPVRVIHAGPLRAEWTTMIEQLGVADRVEVLGVLPRERIAPLQLGGTCLLLIGNRGGLQLPGKLLDYLGAGRPIFALRNDTHDIAADLVESRRAGLVVPNEAEAIAQGLRRLFGEWKDGTIASKYRHDGAADFSWSRIEDDLDRRLRGFVTPHGDAR